MDYIYGKLNYEVEKVQYSGSESTTASTYVNEDERTIAIDVKCVPYNLLIDDKETGEIKGFNGSKDVRIVLSDYTIRKLDEIDSSSFSEYSLIKNGSEIGDKIIIPKNEAIQDIVLRVCEETNNPYDGANPGDYYLDISLSGGADHIYVSMMSIIQVTKDYVDEKVEPFEERLADTIKKSGDIIEDGNKLKFVSNENRDYLEIGFTKNSGSAPINLYFYNTESSIKIGETTDFDCNGIVTPALDVNIITGNPYFTGQPTIESSPIISEKDLNEKLEDKADLIDGIVPIYQLPAFVDDDILTYNKQVSGAGWLEDTLATDLGSIVFNNATAANIDGGSSSKYYKVFLKNVDGTEAGLEIIKPQKNKLYINDSSKAVFAWTGSALTEVSKQLGLGESSTTAYAGNKGKANRNDIDKIISGESVVAKAAADADGNIISDTYVKEASNGIFHDGPESLANFKDFPYNTYDNRYTNFTGYLEGAGSTKLEGFSENYIPYADYLAFFNVETDNIFYILNNGTIFTYDKSNDTAVNWFYAPNIVFDNNKNGHLSATNVQDAIDEVVDTVQEKLEEKLDLETNTDKKITLQTSGRLKLGSSDKTKIGYSATGNIDHYDGDVNRNTDTGKVCWEFEHGKATLRGNDNSPYLQLNENTGYFETFYKGISTGLKSSDSYVKLRFDGSDVFNADENTTKIKTSTGDTVFYANSDISNSGFKVGENHTSILGCDTIDLIPNNDESLDYIDFARKNRIKIGGYEYVRKEDIEDANIQEIIFAYKPADSIDEVVPFAITREGKVYYEGIEIAKNNLLDNKADIQKVDVSGIPTDPQSGQIICVIEKQDNISVQNYYQFNGETWSKLANQSELNSSIANLRNEIETGALTAYPNPEVASHITDKENPHEVTAEQLGLANVDNTSDLDKPISTATQEALDLKANISDLSKVASSGLYSDLVSAPTKLSEFTNDSGYITQASIDNKQDKITAQNPLDYNLLSNRPDIPTIPENISYFNNDNGYLTETTLSLELINSKLVGNITAHTHNQYLTEHQDISGKADVSSLAKVATTGLYSDLINAPDVSEYIKNDEVDQKLVDYVLASSLSKVATSGNYSDLNGKPTIPTVPTLLSAFTNDVGYITANNLKNSFKTINGETILGIGNIAIPIVEKTSDLTNNSGFITADVETLTNFYNKNYIDENKQNKITTANKLDYSLISNTPTIPSKTSQLTNDSDYATTSDLFSKDYNDLTNKPTIPSATSQLTNDSNYITKDVSNLDNYYNKTTIDQKFEDVKVTLPTSMLGWEEVE